MSAWEFLKDGDGFDLSADWPLYAMNRAAAAQLAEMGAPRFTISPEDGLENARALARQFGERATAIAFQDTPLFVSESCAFASRTRVAASSGGWCDWAPTSASSVARAAGVSSCRDASSSGG